MALPELIQAMLRPGFYPHAAAETIELRETHVSYVFLTGQFAYKVKKPVNYGFLDYSTLEKRKHFCEEELRLNRRGAPEIYLEVLPISKSPGGDFRFGIAGEITDYCVRMRQFDEAALFSRLAECKRLVEGDMLELAETLVNFHNLSKRSEYISSFGTVEMVGKAITENYAQTEKYVGGPESAAEFHSTHEFTDAYLADKAHLFDERRLSGHIRECHGDSHLGNICRYDGRVTLFDCIEFNEPFRYVDTMYDLAFACMDLDFRNLFELKWILLNAYLEKSGDYEGICVLPFYLCRQAYVRAKVTSFLLDNPDLSDIQRRQFFDAAHRYYALAAHYAGRRSPRIILMSGLSGSGKSSVGRELAKKLGCVHIRSDAVRKHLCNVRLEDAGQNIYTNEITTATYNRLVELGLAACLSGYTAILDAKYDKASERRRAILAAQEAGYPVDIVHCEASEQALLSRLRQRKGDVSDATEDLLEMQKKSFEPFLPEEEQFVMHLNTEADWTADLWSRFGSEKSFGFN